LLNETTRAFDGFLHHPTLYIEIQVRRLLRCFVLTLSIERTYWTSLQICHNTTSVSLYYLF